MARDLNKVLFNGPLQSAMSHILLPIATAAGQPQLTSHEVLYPHKVFAALWEADEQAFLDQWCGGSQDALQNFWRGMQGTRIYEKARQMGLSKTVPLKFFGDGVAAIGISKAWGKSVDAFLVSSLLSTTSSKTSEVPDSDWGL